jgi:hypothetical protein
MKVPKSVTTFPANAKDNSRRAVRAVLTGWLNGGHVNMETPVTVWEEGDQFRRCYIHPKVRTLADALADLEGDDDLQPWTFYDADWPEPLPVVALNVSKAGVLYVGLEGRGSPGSPGIPPPLQLLPDDPDRWLAFISFKEQ